MFVPGAVGLPDAGPPPLKPKLRLVQLGAADTALAIALAPPYGQERLASREDPGPGPLRIGFHRDLPAEYQGDLIWRLQWVTDPEDGSVSAAVTVTSPGALGMRMAIRAQLPPGGTLRFFGKPASGVVEAIDGGAGVAARLNADAEMLQWSPSAQGDTIGLEITLPSRDAVDETVVEIDRVAHRFRALGSVTTQARGARTSDDLKCEHVNIACRNVGTIQYAVGRISFERIGEGSFWCSGTMMTDTDKSSFVPYFMTAHHCISTQPVADSLEVTWTFQFTDCGGTTPDNRQSETTGGAKLLATSGGQDSTLLRLRGRDSRPVRSFSGWYRGDIARDVSVYGIHHPGGHDKKYSSGTTGRGGDFCLEDKDGECEQQIRNSIPVELTVGATEPGSSGSGLFIGEGLVGVLAGGSGCTDKGYGRFSDFLPQVQRWLDPDGPALSPDLVVEADIDKRLGVTPGEDFTLSALVSNRGSAASEATTVRYYRSQDDRISPLDSEVRTDRVLDLAAGASSSESTRLTAPSAPGTYYYGACVDRVAGESDPDNNCSNAARLTVEDDTSPDLVVEDPRIDPVSVTPGASFTFSARVRNRGDGASEASTLRYHPATGLEGGLQVDRELGRDTVRALEPGDSSSEDIPLTAPSEPGTYYYGACVDLDPRESFDDRQDNCSTAVRLTVEDDTSPNLVVESPRIAPVSVEPGASFTFSARVLNRGDGASEAGTLRYHPATGLEGGIHADRDLGTDAVRPLDPGDSSSESIRLTAPSDAGTHYYAACVDWDPRESSDDRQDNCSTAVRLTVVDDTSTGPDLVVESPRINPVSVTTGASLTLSASVRNRGDGAAESTTLRYYRSTSGTVSTGETEVGTVGVGRLAAGASSGESIDLTAPSTAGTYYYGACVDAVADESDRGNNCSDAVRVTVAAGGGTGNDRDDDTRANATPIELGTGVRDAINEPGDLDWWRFDIPSRGDVVVATTGSVDTVGRLVDASGNLVEENDVDTDSNFRIQRSLDAGTWYVRVAGYLDETGDYTLRVDHTPDPLPTSPDLVVESPSVDTASLGAGASFTLSALVRNQGGGAAASTTLRYYRSTSRTVSTAETAVGTDGVGRLAAGASSDESVGLTAPGTAGIYYYGACVDAVADESDRGNNCSDAVRVTVAAGPVPSFRLGDLNADGYDDVLLRHGESGAWIYYAVDGQRAMLLRVGLTRNLSYGFRGIGDFDGDRQDDVLLRHAASGEWIYYGLDGVRAVLHRARVTRNLSYDYVGAGDFDGYGRDHVLLRHADTGEWIYYALDSGRAVLHRIGVTRNLSYAPAGVGDFDRDGRDDVLLRHTDTGEWIYYALDGGRAVLHRVGLTRNPSYAPAGVGDFDGDGRDDVLLRHADTGEWIYYALDGGRAELRRIGVTRNLSYALAGIGDLTGDGRDDVMLRHAASGEWIYYTLDGRRAVLQRLGATRDLAWAAAGHQREMAPPTMPDDGDTEATATAVDVPSIRLARLETSEDTDYFRIELPGSGRLRAYTTGSTNTSGKLTSADGSVSERNDDSGEGSNFRLVEDVPAGTYFVRVTGDQGATGVYTLHVAFEADGAELGDDHGDTADTATGIGVPSTTSGELEASGDVDYFRLILGSSGTLSAHTTGATDTSGELIREDGTPVVGDQDGGDGANFRFAQAITAGVYLVRVSGEPGATGSYSLHVAFEAGDVEAGDDYGDTPDAATAIGVPSSTAGQLEASGDIDYFRLVLDRPGTLSAYTTGATNTQGELSGDDGSVLGADDDGGGGSNFRIETDVTAGTYLVRVRGAGSATGAYTLHVAFEAGDIEVADDHGDTPDRATDVAVPSSTAGRLGSADDADYFRIKLRRAGTLRAYTTGSINTVGKLTSADGSVSERNDDSGEGTNFRFVEDLSAGTYFVRVTGSRDATGTYTLHVAFETDEVGAADDHVDTADAATPVRVPSSTSGRLESSRDEDYFRIVLDGAGSLTVRTTGSTDTSGGLTREDAVGDGALGFWSVLSEVPDLTIALRAGQNAADRELLTLLAHTPKRVSTLV